MASLVLLTLIYTQEEATGRKSLLKR